MSRSQQAHLNLVDSSRQLFEFDPGAAVETNDRMMLGAGRSTHPVISNAAYRVDDDAPPEEVIAAARAFFDARGRGFSLWARAGVPADAALIEAAEAAGLQRAFAMPEMVLDRRPRGRPPRDGVELRRLASAADAEDYWRVAGAAYASLGFPPEVFAFNESHAGLWDDGVAAFLARVDGRAVGIAMTIVSRCVAGIYWVGTAPASRERGLGRAVTAAAVNAGFEMGGEFASLQASPMGEPLYRSMGFETIFTYEALMSSGASQAAS